MLQLAVETCGCVQFEEAQTQNLIDSKIMEYESRSREAFQAQVLPLLTPALALERGAVSRAACSLLCAIVFPYSTPAQVGLCTQVAAAFQRQMQTPGGARPPGEL